MKKYLMKASGLLIFINLILCGATDVEGQSACRLSETIKAKITKKTMDVKLDKFSFSVPAELEDLTIYTFGPGDGKTILDVTYSEAVGSVDDSQSSVTDFRTELESVMGKAARIESESDTTIANLPAREIKYTIAIEDNRLIRGILADAYDKSNNRIIRMAYTKENGGAVETAAEFEQMRSSTVRTGMPADKPIPAGYKRLFAGAVTVAVKETFHPPRRFSFGSVNGTTQPYLELSFYLESETPPVFEQERAGDEKSMGKLNGAVSSTSVKNGMVEGTQFSYSLLKKSYSNVTEKFAVRRAHLKMSNGVTVNLFGRSDANLEYELNRCFTDVLSTISPVEIKK